MYTELRVRISVVNPDTCYCQTDPCVQVALLDVDICGPSIPRIMGLEGEQVSHRRSDSSCFDYVHGGWSSMEMKYFVLHLCVCVCLSVCRSIRVALAGLLWWVWPSQHKFPRYMYNIPNMYVKWGLTCVCVLQYVEDNLAVMSIGFLLSSPDDAVIWRGPKKNGKFVCLRWALFGQI